MVGGVWITRVPDGKKIKQVKDVIVIKGVLRRVHLMKERVNLRGHLKQVVSQKQIHCVVENIRYLRRLLQKEEGMQQGKKLLIKGIEPKVTIWDDEDLQRNFWQIPKRLNLNRLGLIGVNGKLDDYNDDPHIRET